MLDAASCHLRRILLYTPANNVQGAHCPAHSPILDEITLILTTLIGGFFLIFVVVKFSGDQRMPVLLLNPIPLIHSSNPGQFLAEHLFTHLEVFLGVSWSWVCSHVTEIWPYMWPDVGIREVCDFHVVLLKERGIPSPSPFAGLLDPEDCAADYGCNGRNWGSHPRPWEGIWMFRMRRNEIADISHSWCSRITIY